MNMQKLVRIRKLSLSMVYPPVLSSAWSAGDILILAGKVLLLRMEETDFSPSSWLTSQCSKLWDFASTDFEVLVSSSSWRELVCFSVSGGLSESTLEFNCSSSSKVSCFCCSCNSCQIQWSDYNTDEWDQGAVMGGGHFAGGSCSKSWLVCGVIFR